MIILPEFTFIWSPLRVLIDGVLFLFSLTPESKLLNIARNVLNIRRAAANNVVCTGQRRDLKLMLMKARQRLDQQFKDSDFEKKAFEVVPQDGGVNSNGQHNLTTHGVALTDDDVISQIYVVMAAGYETTSTVSDVQLGKSLGCSRTATERNRQDQS